MSLNPPKDFLWTHGGKTDVNNTFDNALAPVVVEAARFIVVREYEENSCNIRLHSHSYKKTKELIISSCSQFLYTRQSGQQPL